MNMLRPIFDRKSIGINLRYLKISFYCEVVNFTWKDTCLLEINYTVLNIVFSGKKVESGERTKGRITKEPVKEEHKPLFATKLGKPLIS